MRGLALSSRVAQRSYGGFRGWHGLLLSLLFLLAMAAAALAAPEPLLSPWFAFASCGFLYVAFRLCWLRLRLPEGVRVSLHALPVWAAFLGLGFLPAGVVLLVGAALAGVADLLLPGDGEAFPRRPWLGLLTHAGLDVLTLGPALLVGGWLYLALGGRVPLVGLQPADLPLLLGFFAAAVTVRSGLRLAFGRATGAEGWGEATRRLLHVLLAEGLPVVPALVLALALYAFDLLGFALFLWALWLGVLLARAMGASRADLQRHLDELAALGLVEEALAATLPPEALFQAVYERVSRLLVAPLFYIALPDAERQQLDFPLVMEGGHPVSWPSRAWSDGPTEYILRHRRPLLLRPRCAEAARRLRIAAGDFGSPCRAYLGVPILYQDEALGVLAVEHPTDPDAYTAAEQRVLELVAAQAGVALGTARLLGGSQHLADSLLAISKVSNIVNASLDRPAILSKIAEVALQLGQARQGAVFLRGEDNPALRPAYHIGLDPAFLEALGAFSAEAEHPWMARLAGAQIVTVPDLEADPTAAWLRPAGAQAGVRALVLVPLISLRSVIEEATLPRHDLIGVLVVCQPLPARPSEHTLHLLTVLADQATVAIENAYLFEETQNAVKRLAYLAEATRIFTASLELDRVCQAVVDWTVDALELDSATLALWNREEGLLAVQAYARGAQAPLRVRPVELPYPLAELPEFADVLHGRWSRVFHQQEPGLRPAMQGIFAGSGLATLVLTPLVVRSEVIGVLALGLVDRQHLTANEVSLAEAIASQAATAIQNAQFYVLTESALSDRLTEISALETVLRRISASVEEGVIINDVLEAAHTVTSADLVSCALLTSRNTLSLIWRYADAPEIVHRREFPDPTRGITGRVLRTGQPVLIPDTTQEPAYWLPEGISQQLLSELCVPIMYEGRPLGVLNLESARCGAFNEYHLRFMQNLSGHAAIAIERARLFESRQRQIEILDIMRRLSLDLLEVPDLDAVLEKVCVVGLYLVSGVNVHLYFYDEATDRLTFAASLWDDGRRNVEATPPRPDGLTRRAVASGEPIVSDEFVPLPGSRTRLLGCFPLKYSGQTVGVLNAAVDDPTKLGEDEFRALELLANQAAIAIERARLFEGRQRQIEMLEALRDLSLNLLDALKLEIVLDMVCHSALGIVKAQDVHLYFYDEATDRLTFAASLWADGRRNIEVATPRPTGVTRRTARSGAPVILDAQTPEEESFLFPAQTVVGIPLKHAGQVIGVLNVAVTDPAQVGENEIRALELLANQAAVAVRNVRLYEAVRDGRDRMQAVLNTVRDGLVLVDGEGYLLQINPAAERFVGRDMRPFIGQHFIRVLRTLERQGWQASDYFSWEELRAMLLDLRENPYRLTRRELKVRLGNQDCYFEEESAPVLAEDGEPIGRLFVWHDVTETRALEDARAELIHTIVHDLRSPLTAIKGGLNVLHELGQDPSETALAQEILQVVENSTDGLLALVESLLDVARLETGQMPLEFTAAPLAVPLDEAVRLMGVLAQEADVALQAQVPEALPLLHIDIDKVRRVFINLLDNALRFTPSGGRVVVQAAPEPGGRHVRVTVTDSGPGIPPDARARIFERFATGLTGLPQRGRKGLGLGLTFCRLAVEAHGGRIWVEDAPGGGAAFIFTLPVAEPSFAATPASGA